MFGAYTYVAIRTLTVDFMFQIRKYPMTMREGGLLLISTTYQIGSTKA